MYPVACNYGVGSGLFQGSPVKPGKGSVDTHYQVLGIPTWATKQEIERRYQELKRQSTKVARQPAILANITEAYSTLSDLELRKTYDESLGLNAKRRSRIDLRPLGFHSKSLSPAQQNWTTWERELLAVLLGLEHFSSVVRGHEVEIHTDHLNNTILGLSLIHI